MNNGVTLAHVLTPSSSAQPMSVSGGVVHLDRHLNLQAFDATDPSHVRNQHVPTPKHAFS